MGDTFKTLAEAGIRAQLDSCSDWAARARNCQYAITTRVGGILDKIGALPSADDVQMVDVGFGYEGGHDAKVRLFLDPARRESTLVRELARAFSLTLDKAKAWNDESITATGTVDHVGLTVEGYKPTGCRIEEETVEVPATTRVVRRIVCQPEEGDE